MRIGHKLKCIFFDLDGTLLDTAPDLISALNNALIGEGFPPAPAETIKPYISKGAAGMVRFCVGNDLGDDEQESLVHQMTAYYREHIADDTRLYEGMDKVLDTLEDRGIDWGIVTNKRAWLTDPLLQKLNLHSRPVCVISGDTTKNRKPHPEPLFAACKQSGYQPLECLYIGDAERDITAGQRAGLSTLAATYGYLDQQDQPENWGACGLIDHPLGLISWLNENLP